MQDPAARRGLRDQTVGVIGMPEAIGVFMARMKRCCFLFVVVSMALLVLLAITFSIDWGVGAGSPGEPLSDMQWEAMNHRHLFFANMAMNMVLKHGDEWGANPVQIANPDAYFFRPQNAPDPYANKYIQSIEKMSLIGYDTFTFPEELKFPSPRWSVVRIRHKPGLGGDALVIVFRGSAGDPQSSLDWNTFDALNDPSLVAQEDGTRFTVGFFDASLCEFLAHGLLAVLQSPEVAGVSEVFTVGHSLGGAWASILMTRLAPGVSTTCPGRPAFMSPFESLAAQAVTWGKPGPFYVASGEPIPSSITNLAARETDYVYHGDTIARGNHGGVRYCVGLCWSVLPLSGQPFFKRGHVSYIQNHYHGDTTTIWVMNQMHGRYQVSSMPGYQYPKAERHQIGVFFNEVDRSASINTGFIVGRFLPAVLAAAGEEHGNAYGWNLWYYQPGSTDMHRGSDRVVIV